MRPGIKNLIADCEVGFYHTLVSPEQTSMGSSAASLSGVDIILKSIKSSSMNLSARFSTLHIALSLLGNLFWAK